MKSLFHTALVLGLFTSFSVSASGVAAPGSVRLAGNPKLDSLRDAPLMNLEGEVVRFGDAAGDGPIVIAYTGVGCPISGKYAPRLERFSESFGARGVRFVMIAAGPNESREAIGRECEELGIEFAVLKDHRQELTRRLGARTTTEVFLFDGAGTLRYRGAVDDQYDLGAAKPEPTRNFLADALEAVLGGKSVETKETPAPGCKLTLLPEEELPDAVTWSKDIAPIIQANCESCHRPGQVGPFPLQTYEQAKNWAAMIGLVVEERRMPPWNAAERFDGHFANQRSLSKANRAKVLQWVAEGMPRGNPDEDPAPRKWRDGWNIGEPDVIFEPARYMETGEPLPAEGFRVKREGTVEYQHFVVDTNFPEDRWIQAMEILPGAADVVHHVVVAVHDPKKGPFNERTLINYLAVAVPGDTPSVYPEGYAKRLPAGCQLIFQLHYTPNGKERFDRSRLGLVFAEEEPIFEVLTDAILNRYFTIPAGDPNFEIRDEVRIDEDMGLIMLYPHMHTRGKDWQFIAHYPDGTQEELLYVDYDFNWQESYVYFDPKPMPSGTRLEAIAHYDNSAANPNNPAPDEDVEWGEQTWEEMFVGTYDHVVFIED